MTLGAHVAFASVLYLGGATLFGYRPDAISGALAAIASLLPDIDLPPARIGRLFGFVSVPLAGSGEQGGDGPAVRLGGRGGRRRD
ncbi:MAG: metal-dependent hydrolase [Candidatus Contendobacter sp.]|nr:metal-dependent hydrolase [Candidatus Contendobacter sp.]